MWELFPHFSHTVWELFKQFSHTVWGNLLFPRILISILKARILVRNTFTCWRGLGALWAPSPLQQDHHRCISSVLAHYNMKPFWHHEPQESSLQRTEGAQRAPSVLCNDNSTHFFVLYLIFSHEFHESEFQKYPIIRLIILFPANTHYWMPMSVWVVFIVCSIPAVSWHLVIVLFRQYHDTLLLDHDRAICIVLLSEINVLVNPCIDDSYFINFIN